MKTTKYSCLLLLLLAPCMVGAQQDIVLNKKFAFKDYCFDSQIKTILMYRSGNEFSEPLIELGSTDELTIMFDDLLVAGRSLYYTVVHCDADWNEDNTFQNDYMKGFAQNPLRDYDYSINTKVPYIHYSFQIPNRDISLTASGNYLLKVYETSKSDKLLFQKGFSVIERMAGVRAEYDNLTFKGQLDKQQLNFVVSYPTLYIQDPSRDLKIRIERNSHRLPGIPIATPTFIAGTTADYSLPNKNIYDGGNEYRIFDTRTLEFGAQGVSNIERTTETYHVLLDNAAVRANKPYLSDRDLNGKYFIDSYKKQRDKNTEADYADVYFTLPASQPYPNTTLYVYGQLSDFSICNTHAMVYNETRKAYELTLQLKQGFYSYKIIAVDAKGTFNSGLIEGNFSETENTYGIFVYCHSSLDRWDRLVGVEYVNTAGNAIGNTILK